MKERYLFLQLFAEEEGNAPEQAVDNQAKEGEAKGSSFDEFLKDAKNQSEFDKRVAKALETQRTNLLAEHEKSLQEAKKEADKLAKMNADQKKEYELEQIKAENERLKAENLANTLRAEASNRLEKAEITASKDMLDLVLGKDQDTTEANVDKLVAIIQAEVKKGEQKRATGSTPPSYKPNGGAMTEIEKRLAKYRSN